MRFTSIWFAFWLIASVVYGAQPVIEGPDQVEVNTPAWFWIGGVESGISAVWFPATIVDVNPQHIRVGSALFFEKVPGVYALSVIVVNWDKRSLVLLTRSVTVIEGENPPPPPPPIPPQPDPNQKWQVVIVYESNDLDNYPRGQQVLISSLTFRVALGDKGHVLVAGGIVDQHITDRDGKMPVALKSFLESCIGKPLPRICLATMDGGKVESYPLMETGEKVLKFLNDPREYNWSMRLIHQYRLRLQLMKPPRQKLIDGGAGMRVRVPINWLPPVGCPGGVCPPDGCPEGVCP